MRHHIGNADFGNGGRRIGRKPTLGEGRGEGRSRRRSKQQQQQQHGMTMMGAIMAMRMAE